MTERQVAEADLLQGGKPFPDGGLQVNGQRVAQTPDPGVQPGDGHGAYLRDVQPFDLAAEDLGIESCAAAVRAGAHPQHRIEHGRVEQPFFGVDDAAVHPRDQALVFRALRPAGRRILEPDLRAVQEQVQFFRRVIPDFLVEVEQAAAGVADPAPAALPEGDVMDGIFVVEALVEIHEFVDVEFPDLTQSGAARAAALRMVEAETVGVAHERFAHAREQQADQRVDIRIGADGGAGVLGGFLLVDDDGDGQPLDRIDFRPAVFGEILLHESGEGVVELAAAFRREGVHDQGTLSGAGYAGEDGDLVFGNVERQVAEIVFAGPAHADGIEGIHRQRP